MNPGSAMTLRMLQMSVVAAILAVLVGQQIDVRPRFRVGDEFQLEITNAVEDSRPSQARVAVRNRVDMRVTSAGPAGYELEWRSTALDAPSEPETLDPGQVASRIGSSVAFGLRLTPEGELAGVMRQDELVRTLEAAREQAIKEALDRRPTVDRAGAEGLLRQLLAPAALIGVALRDAVHYTGIYGQRLSLGEPIERADESVTPFDSKPVPVRMRFSLLSLTDTEAVLEGAGQYDAKALRSAIDRFLAATGRQSGAEALLAGGIELSESTRYVYDRRSGVMREVVHERRISYGEARRVERWTARLVEKNLRNPRDPGTSPIGPSV